MRIKRLLLTVTFGLTLALFLIVGLQGNLPRVHAATYTVTNNDPSGDGPRPVVKFDGVGTGWQGDAAQDGVGAQDGDGLAVVAGLPAGVPHLAQDEEAGGLQLGFYDQVVRRFFHDPGRGGISGSVEGLATLDEGSAGQVNIQ